MREVYNDFEVFVFCNSVFFWRKKMGKFRWFLNTIAVLISMQIGSAAAGSDLDTSFLKEPPYKKTKQKVDLSSIQTKHDMLVVKEAINPVMTFIVSATFAELPAIVAKDFMTEHGRAVLQRPPLRNKTNRYSSRRFHNWRVCGDNALSVSVVFGDLFREKSWAADFFFVNEGNGWRFDDHREAKC